MKTYIFAILILNFKLMKGILSFSLTAVMAFTAYSQTLWSDNFDTYTVGNLGAQGGWLRFNGSNAMGKVASLDTAHGKSFQLASTASNTDGVFFYHEFDASTRTSGNDIFVTEYEVRPDANYGILQIYDEGATQYVADIALYPGDGFVVYTQNDSDNETTGTFIEADIVANTWYKVKVSYEFYTGTIIVTINGIEYPAVEGYAGIVPGEINLVGVEANTSAFDNIRISAVSSLLAASDVAKKSTVSVYPNPATDVINVKSDSKITQISIYDFAGKVVKTTAETSVNVENLAKGSYVVSIKYADGTTESKKVIKK